MTEPEEWSGWSEPREELVSLSGRIEVHSITAGLGDYTTLIDPEHATKEKPSGAENIPLVVLDLVGHAHVMGRCIPARAPFVLTSVTLDELVDSLTEIRDQMDSCYPHRERRERK